MPPKQEKKAPATQVVEAKPEVKQAVHKRVLTAEGWRRRLLKERQPAKRQAAKK